MAGEGEATAAGIGLPEIGTAFLPEEEGWSAWLLTGLGMGLDSVLLRAMRLVVEAALAPKPEDIPALRRAAEPYLAGELQRDPRRFFAFVDAGPPSPPVQVSERLRRRLQGGVVVARQFLSSCEPYCERDEPRCLENERIPVEHWMHESPRATVVALHGFSMGHPYIDGFAMMANEWFRHGIDVVLVTLPFHGARCPKTARFSGEYFAAPDAGRLNEAVRLAVHDVQQILAWVRESTGRPAGLLGLSLGGYISALMAGLTERLDFVVPMVPPVDLADLAWRFFLNSGRLLSGEHAPFTRDIHRAVYRVHSPLTYAPRVPRERLLIVAGRGDRIVPPEHPHALWCHWGRPAIHWFSGSHIAPFRRGRIAAAILNHLRGLDIL